MPKSVNTEQKKMLSISDYARGLSKENKSLYIEKVQMLGGQDPYAIDIKSFTLSLDNVPRVTLAEITEFLIFRVSSHTQKEIRAYKSLDAFARLASRWIQDIRAKEINDHFCVLGKVMHSQKINEKPLCVWLVLSKHGKVVASHCNCIAGLGEACSHIASILFALDFAGKKSESVTDVLAYWIGPKNKTSFYKKIQDIEFSAGKKDTPASQEYEVIPELTNDEVQDFLKTYQGTSVLHVFNQDGTETTNNSVLLTNLYQDKFRKYNLAELRHISEGINITINREDIEKTETETRLQSQSKKWFLLRAGRITASNFRSVCCTRIEKPAVSLLKKVCYPHVYKKTFNAGLYGCKHEEQAIKMFETYHGNLHVNCKIKKSGLILNENYPYFAATPDGIMECDICGRGCVEVKCPFCAKDTSVSELLQIKKICLSGENAILLKRDHAYYFQVQMQMALSKLEFCFFVVWSPKDFFVEKIAFDQKFWSEKSCIAKEFHKKVVMPELLAKFYTIPKTSLPSDVDMSMPDPTKIISSSPVFVEEDSDKNLELWCHCRRPDDGDQMVVCSNKKCSIKWYHANCLTLKKIPKGKWFCNLCK